MWRINVPNGDRVIPLNLIKLTPLMQQSSGDTRVTIGLIDGPVMLTHPDLARHNLREISGGMGASCFDTNKMACLHATFVAGILSAKRGSAAPAICPDCTLLIRPIFFSKTSGQEQIPSATPQELATAIIECIAAGARIVNLSLALAQPTLKSEQALTEAINHAAKLGVIVVAAAGNQGTLCSSAITRHPWVIPVAACDLSGRPINGTNLGRSIGKLGLSAPGDNITSLGTEGKPLTSAGTSVAVPFVTGTIALLWSVFPAATAAQIKLALLHTSSPRRAALVPPLLDANAAYQSLVTNHLTR
jgi:subtilisin family serine protease